MEQHRLVVGGDGGGGGGKWEGVKRYKAPVVSQSLVRTLMLGCKAQG